MTCYKHPRFMDAFWEVYRTYPTNSGVKVVFKWYNRNGDYPMFSKRSSIKLSKAKWREFKPINRKDFCI